MAAESESLKQLEKAGIHFKFVTDSVVDTPFWKTAEDTDDQFVKVHHVQQNETPADFLIRTCGTTNIFMDCNIFNQFLYQLSNWESGPMFFAIPASDVAKIIRSTLVDKNCFYLTITDPEVTDYLMKSPFSAKGQWLYRVDDDAYVGLSTYGVLIQTKDEWCNLMKADLKAQIQNYSYDKKHNMCIMIYSVVGILKCYLGMNKLENWDFVDVQLKF